MQSDGTVANVDRVTALDGVAGLEFYDGILVLGLVYTDSRLEPSMLDQMRELQRQGVELTAILTWATLKGVERGGISVIGGIDWKTMTLTERTTIRQITEPPNPDL